MNILLKIPLFIFLSINVFANILANEITFETTSGNDIEIKTFASDGENLIMYLPNSRGLGNQYSRWATNLTFDGFDTWVLDLHASYMLPTTKSSLDKINTTDLIEVIDYAKRQGFKNLYFITSSRGAKIALQVAYYYQKKYQNNFIKGHIFHSPHLINGKVAIGEKAQYDEIAKYNNLPTYIMMSNASTKFARLDEIKKLLATSGAQIYTQIFKGVSAGFFMKPNSKLTSKDILTRNDLATTYNNALNLLQSSEITTLQPMVTRAQQHKKVKFTTELKPLNQQSKPLILQNIDDNTINLKDYKNSVILLNFWASWCAPCVREIPSLLRLRDKINSPNFKIITVNIGENKQKITKFKQKLKRQQQVDFDLEILLDTSGEGVKNWNVYAYPSNYILDKNSNITYGYSGALHWDDPKIIQKINALMYAK